MRTPVLICALAVAAPLALAACGASAPTAVPFPTVIPTRAVVSAPQATRTALGRPETPVAGLATPGTPLSVQATASRAAGPSASLAVSPTASVAGRTTASIGTPDAGQVVYAADFGRWFVGDAPASAPARLSFDPAAAEYVIALVDPASPAGRAHRMYAPEPLALANYTASVDIRQVGGIPGASAALLLRVQAPAAGQADATDWIQVSLTTDGRVLIYQAAASGGRTLYGPTAAPAVATGSAVNHLVVALRGSTVTVSVNGQAVAVATTDLVAPGSLGISETGPAAVQGSPAAAGFARLAARVIEVR